MNKIFLYFLLMCLLFPFSVFSKVFSLRIFDAATVKGKVIAKSDNTSINSAAVPNAPLTLAAVGNSPIEFTTMSDDTGAFVFDNVPAGNYLLTIEANGFPKLTRELNILSGAVLVVDIDLTVEISEQVTVREEDKLRCERKKEYFRLKKQQHQILFAPKQ